MVDMDLSELRTTVYWRAIAAEFAATFFLVFVGCGATLPFRPDEGLDIVKVSLTFGIMVAAMGQLFGGISGAHLNPAVSLAMLVTKKISPLKAGMYMISQCTGAICGATLLHIVTPSQARGDLGANGLLNNTTIAQGLIIEIVLTMIFVLVIFSAAVDTRNKTGNMTPLFIGLTLSAINFFGIPYTGGSSNPARSFGPAMVSGQWDYHWIFWLGPMSGGALAAAMYHYLLAPPDKDKNDDTRSGTDTDSELQPVRPQGRKNSDFSLGDLHSLDTDLDSATLYINHRPAPPVPARRANPAILQLPQITISNLTGCPVNPRSSV